MTAKKQLVFSLIDQLPDNEFDIVFEVIRRFVPSEVATEHDEQMYIEGMEEYARGECVRLDDIDLDAAPTTDDD
jgi:hypothetical protein